MFFRSRRYSGAASSEKSSSSSSGGAGNGGTILHSAFHSTSISGGIGPTTTSSTTTTSSATAVARDTNITNNINGRFRYERPNSAPLPSSSASLSHSPSPPPATLLQQSPVATVTAGSSPSSANAPLLLASGSHSQSAFRQQESDVSLVEQRLKIIKRNRASSAAKTSATPEYTELPSPSKVGAMRLAKHEQHVVDAMVTECLDALLFPSALFMDES